MVYQLTETLVADRIAELLQREGAESVVGFPENRLLNSASLIGMRPIITRTERVAVNIADGFARATNGERILPCVTQYAPGAESAFGAVAQAYGDRSPILLCPSEHAVADQDSEPNFRIEAAYRPITRWAGTLNDPARGPEIFRRALNALRGVRNGPVLGRARQRRAERPARRRRLVARLDRGALARRPRRRTSSRPRGCSPARRRR